ncbi:hypothetical protein RvY_06061 [Ramazzottius varieornatus]|uniref:Uncharacterized protein n=1 Tax=Ramazzottius varieornatus TaxID=947166 RepID=A0A1D1V077_RAMVA|nr:hypothetical protein RvY_06061 [Ramazzottius varieornatus]
MFWNIILPVIFFLISCSDCGKANAKRGSRHDSGKLLATLCHYYSDASMGCKECFEVARTHRSNHNSTLLPPCKSTQGIKRRNWTLDEGIITNGVIDVNATKRLTLASCAFYANKTFTCVSTRPLCNNATDVECGANTSWSSRYEGSINDGFRRIGLSSIHGVKIPSTTAWTTKGSWTTSSPLSNTDIPPGNSSSSSVKKELDSSTSSTPFTFASSSSPKPSKPTKSTTMPTHMLGQAADSANEIHKIPILEVSSPSPSSTTKVNMVLEMGSSNKNGSQPKKPSTLVNTQAQVVDANEFTENCTETSCTIFADNSNHTSTHLNVSATNLRESSALTAADNITTSTNSTAGNETVISAVPTANNASSTYYASYGSTKLFATTSLPSSLANVERIELVTSSSQRTLSSSTGRTETSLTSSRSTITTLQPPAVHTFSTSRSSVKPEPRKRVSLRRMY